MPRLENSRPSAHLISIHVCNKNSNAQLFLSRNIGGAGGDWKCTRAAAEQQERERDAAAFSIHTFMFTYSRGAAVCMWATQLLSVCVDILKWHQRQLTPRTTSGRLVLFQFLFCWSPSTKTGGEGRLPSSLSIWRNATVTVSHSITHRSMLVDVGQLSCWREPWGTLNQCHFLLSRVKFNSNWGGNTNLNLH